MEKPSKPTNIFGKLIAIQKSIKTFATSEDSGKINVKTGKASYQFTPGWVIAERIRELMDENNLLLVPNYRIGSIREEEFPVPVEYKGNIETFQKKDALVVVEADYTWFDADTGESFGPFRCDAANMNNIDKSAASAISFSERYFFLKFFHITTHDTADEPDYYDNGAPETPQGGQGRRASFPQAAAPQAPPAPAYAAVPPAAPAPAVPPAYRQPQAPAYAAPPVQQQAPRQYDGCFNDQDPNIAIVVEKLSHFRKGSESFHKTFNEGLADLSAKGYNCNDRRFIDNIAEAAAARREGRNPEYV